MAWISVLLAFGIAQGVIYLRSFWGSFGLDPFQFSSASDLALVGFTAIGVTLAFLAGAALLGGYLADLLTRHSQKGKLVPTIASTLLIGGFVALALVVDLGLYLLIGLVLTCTIVWLSHRSPDVPIHLKQSNLIAYVALAVAYVPMASHYFGQHKAKTVLKSDKALHLSSEHSVGTGLPVGEQVFVGRLGGEYVFYSAASQSVSIVQANAVQKISLRPREH